MILMLVRKIKEDKILQFRYPQKMATIKKILFDKINSSWSCVRLKSHNMTLHVFNQSDYRLNPYIEFNNKSCKIMLNFRNIRYRNLIKCYGCDY